MDPASAGATVLVPEAYVGADNAGSLGSAPPARAPDQEKPVVRVDEDRYVDVSDVVVDYDAAFFAGGYRELQDVVTERVEQGQVSRFDGSRIGAPFARPHQILCIGLHYRGHAAETGQQVPAEPILFTKSTNTLVGPDDDVRLPRGGEKTDWEVELGVVVARRPATWTARRRLETTSPATSSSTT